MSDYRNHVKDKKTQNWLKASFAINVAKEGLSDFVNKCMLQLQQQILNDVRRKNDLPESATCNTCTTGNAVPCSSTHACPNSCKIHRGSSNSYRVCPNRICNDFALEVKKYHRYHGPSWKNTDCSKWCSSAWAVAKCYHPPDGYLDKADATVTDFNGVVSVIINCKDFENHVTEDLSDKKHIFIQSRDVVKHIRHSATLTVEVKDLEDVFTAMRAILSDSKELRGNTQAEEAMKTLSELETEALTITTDDVTKLIQEALNETRIILSEAMHVAEEAKDTHSENNYLQSKHECLISRDDELRELKTLLEVAETALNKTSWFNVAKDLVHVGAGVVKDAAQKVWSMSDKTKETRQKEPRQCVERDAHVEDQTRVKNLEDQDNVYVKKEQETSDSADNEQKGGIFSFFKNKST